MGRHPGPRGLFELPAIAERDAGRLGEPDDREVTRLPVRSWCARQSKKPATEGAFGLDLAGPSRESREARQNSMRSLATRTLPEKYLFI